MWYIPLLGGPDDGAPVPVEPGKPPPPHLPRFERVRIPPPSVSFRKWLRERGFGIRSLAEDEKARLRLRYDALRRNGGGVEEREVFYRLVRWGDPWRLHYAHPDHPVAQLAQLY